MLIPVSDRSQPLTPAPLMCQGHFPLSCITNSVQADLASVSFPFNIPPPNIMWSLTLCNTQSLRFQWYIVSKATVLKPGLGGGAGMVAVSSKAASVSAQTQNCRTVGLEGASRGHLAQWFSTRGPEQVSTKPGQC